MNNFMNASQPALRDAANSLNDLFDQGMRITTRLLDSMSQMRSSMMTAATQPGGLGMSMGTSKCSCDIPPPCWMPVSLGELTTFVCGGSTASLRIRVTNCSNVQRTITVDSKQGEGVQITPATVVLGPMERTEVLISRPVPATAVAGFKSEALIWVRGCKEHFLRWTVQVADRGGSCGHEIDVNDCPDLIHHWYDHFYCERGCPRR